MSYDSQYSSLTGNADSKLLIGQDLKIWEIASKGPLLLPHRNTQGMDAWTVEGREQILFQRFAIRKVLARGSLALHGALPRLARCSGCSTHRAKPERLDHHGDIISYRNFGAFSIDETNVLISDEKVTFTTSEDAQILCCLIEAAEFYLTGRLSNSNESEDLEAYTLLMAVTNGYGDAVERLLQGKSPRKEIHLNALEETAFAIASSLASQQWGHELDDQDFDNSPDFIYKIGMGAKSAPNETSLFSWAIQGGDDSLVRLLINERVVLSSGGQWQHLSPLGLASFCGHEAVVRSVLECDHDPYKTGIVPDSLGRSPLHHAASRGYENVTRLLLESGAEPRAKDKCRDTPLHLAAGRGHESVVQLLIDRDAEIEAKDIYGCTPLMDAVMRGHVSAAMLLLEEGANTLETCNKGMNATHFALEGSMPPGVVQNVLKKAFERRESPAEFLPRRVRISVTLEMDSDWSRFMLDTYNAIIVMPDEIPSNVDFRYGKTFRINQPLNAIAGYFKLTLTFIIEGPESCLRDQIELDFSVSLGSNGTTHEGGRVRIVFDDALSNISERISRPTRHGGRHFQSLSVGSPGIHLIKETEETNYFLRRNSSLLGRRDNPNRFLGRREPQP